MQDDGLADDDDDCFGILYNGGRPSSWLLHGVIDE